MHIRNKVKMSMLIGACMFIVSALGGSAAQAIEAPQSMLTGFSTPEQAAIVSEPVNDIPLEIEPVCSDAASMTSRWTVTNKNEHTIELGWNNIENSSNGTFNAVFGKSQLITYYNPLDPNNRTIFTYSGNTSSTNAQVAPCAPVVPPVDPTPCIDGNIQQNLVVTFLTKDSIEVKTKDNVPLCEDVTVYFSSYIMPDNYDGNGFENNPTAYPQSLFNSAHATLKAGESTITILKVNLPSECKNIQVDLYYAPEVTTIGAEGHGEKNIISQIYAANKTSPLCSGGNGEVTPPVVVPPTPPTSPVVPMLPVGGNGSAAGSNIVPANQVVSKPAQLPSELPETGTSQNLSIIYGLLLALLTYGAVYLAKPKRMDS